MPLSAMQRAKHNLQNENKMVDTFLMCIMCRNYSISHIPYQRNPHEYSTENDQLSCNSTIHTQKWKKQKNVSFPEYATKNSKYNIETNQKVRKRWVCCSGKSTKHKVRNFCDMKHVLNFFFLVPFSKPLDFYDVAMQNIWGRYSFTFFKSF